MVKTGFLFALLTALLAPLYSHAFTGTSLPKKSFVASSSKSALGIGPLQKVTNKKEYNKVVEGLMQTKGYTKEQAEKEYNDYLENPTNYALNKGEEYYKSLGYDSLMDGIIGEADKEGKGDEVRQRLAEFKKQSQLKGLATIGFFITLFVYYKITHPFVPH